MPDSAYHYVRHRWWGEVDVSRLVQRFSVDYEVDYRSPPVDESRMSIQSFALEELRVRADTLMAFLSPYRAVLSQRERAPFTTRDMDLRRRVFEIYPHERPTPLPFVTNTEPPFEVEGGDAARAGPRELKS
jgi:hypothetical protein